MLKVGDKVRVLDNKHPTSVFSCEVGDIVEIIGIEPDGFLYFKNRNGAEQYINPEQLALVEDEDYKILPNFKIGDKVRLNTDEETSDYYSITTPMIEDYDVLTIKGIKNTSYGGDGSYMIMVQENDFNYHSDWLELVEDDQEEMMEDDQEEMMAYVEEEIGYTTITGVHFGNHGEYTWQCDRDLFKDIKLLDLILVDTVEGEQVVQVVKKSETLDIKHIYKKVIKKLEFY